jgi:tetratricopeptide (TPR) repeat protein
MRALCLVAMGLLLATASLHAADALSDARRFYNQGQFEAAERAAREAARVPASADAARVVLGRIQLERYRRTPVAADLSGAISAFASIDARRLEPRERVELAIGLGQALYLEDRFGAAAALFESVLNWSQSLGPVAHERVLDWWATAVDRQAQLRPPAERGEMYGRISTRMAEEISQDAGSTAAGYWLAASARGIGDLERALNEATAAWVRASLARDRGVALRADLDRLVVQGILPDRAARLTMRDNTQALAGMVGEWEAFKSSWSR